MVMQKVWFAVAAVSLLGLTAASGSAAVVATTQEDFAAWSGGANVGTASATGDTDGSVTNGAWNSTHAGGTGTAGALTITVTSGHGYDQTVISLSTSLAPTLSGAQVIIDYDATNMTGGSYFQPLAFINTDGYWGGTASTTDVANGSHHTATYTLPTLTASSFSYLQFGVLANTDRTGTFTIDNVRVSAVPEPASLGLLSAGSLALLARRRARKA